MLRANSDARTNMKMEGNIFSHDLFFPVPLPQRRKSRGGQGGHVHPNVGWGGGE